MLKEWKFANLCASLSLIMILPAFPSAAAGEVAETDYIVVSATRTPQPATEVAGSVIIIEGEQIRSSASRDLKGILQSSPFIVINDSGSPGAVATPSIRGSLSTQVLVLLDGVRLSNAQSSFFNLNDLPLPLERIERIEILPVPSSALYGADALGGVINIVTRPVEPEGAARFSIGGGSYGETLASATVQAGVGGVGLRIDGQRRSGDGHRENADFERDTISLGLRKVWAPMEMEFSWNYLDGEGGSPGHVAFTSPDARQNDEKHYLRFTSRLSPGGIWDGVMHLFYDMQDREYRDPALGEESRHENRKGGVDLQGNVDSGRWGLWSMGGEWIRDRVDSTDDGKHETERWAIFIQDEIESGPWSTVATLRLDEHEVYGSEVNPRLAVVRRFAAGLRSWASVSRGFRAPNFDDLFWNGSYGKGNPDLVPERSWNIELGGEKRWEGGHRIGVTLFSRKVDDLIRWTDPDNDYVYSPENIASARIRGVESEVEFRPLRWLSLPVSYQYLDATDRDTGEDLPGQVRHLLRAAARARAGSVTLTAEAAYTERNSTPRVDEWSHTVVTASALWVTAIGGAPLRLSLRADNVFNEPYENVEGFPMPGRGIFGEAGISF